MLIRLQKTTNSQSHLFTGGGEKITGNINYKNISWEGMKNKKQDIACYQRHEGNMDLIPQTKPPYQDCH